MELTTLSFYWFPVLLPAFIFSQNQRGNQEFAYICGKFPNRYFSYQPCPEDERKPSQNQRNRDGQQSVRDQQQICTRQGWQPIGIRCQNVNDCYQHRENVAMMCEKGQCCSPVGPATSGQDGRSTGAGRDGKTKNADTYVWWQTCENGGYFTGQTCQTTSECRQGYGPGGQRLDQRLAKYEQICLQGECCTTNRELDIENRITSNQNSRTNTNTNPNQRPNPNNPRTNPSLPANQPKPPSCETFQGGRLVRSSAPCRRHSDCNRLVGSPNAGLVRVSDTQQLACVAQQCCLMNRQLPPGITDWQQLCPLRQGSFTGMFCNQNDGDCDTAASSSSLRRSGGSSSRSLVCELNRYCCTSFIDRSRRQNQGCDDGDMITGSRCEEERDCYRGEYCGDLKICCVPRPNAQSDERTRPNRPRPPPPAGQRIREPTAAFCYNGQQSSVTCEFQSDCLEDTQSCVNGLCCVRSGNEWKSACGGAMAVSNCFQDRTCHDSLVCTSSDYCCECPYGQTTGKCTHGCPPNFACSSNGFCCPHCASGAQPYGSCFNARCAPGYTCVAGNICCPNEARTRL